MYYKLHTLIAQMFKSLFHEDKEVITDLIYNKVSAKNFSFFDQTLSNFSPLWVTILAVARGVTLYSELWPNLNYSLLQAHNGAARKT